MEHTNNKVQTFMNKFKADLAAGITIEKVKARVLELDEMHEAAELIKSNKLVAFPTETVYGLGANATNEAALLSIYSTKRRPLSDPIIVHVLDQQQALSLVVVTAEQEKVFMHLTNKFWPGPLTVILKANLNKLPLVVTAGSGFVGLRSPKQQTARKLIELSGLPIGAPSANLFGHVSPTEPVHVFNDFYDQEVAVIDGQRCEYGLESTVVKLNAGKLQILRQGSLTLEKMRSGLKGTPIENMEIQVVQLVKKDKEIQESPGQLFKHYAPSLPCYFYQCDSEKKADIPQKQKYSMKDTVLISFSSCYDELRERVGLYLRVGTQLSNSTNQLLEQEDFFCSAQEKRLMKQIYYLLRRGQNSGFKLIVIAWQGERKGAIWDKISRATQTKQIYMSSTKQAFVSN